MEAIGFRRVTTIALSSLLISSFIVITNGSFSDASSNSPEEVSAASGLNRFVVWEDLPWGGRPEIFLRRSADNGATWKPTVNLSNNPGGSFNPEIAVSGSNVYVVWLQVNAEGTLEDVFFRRSTDNGVTWKPFVKITSIGTVGSKSTPLVTQSGSNVYVIWEQEAGEIYFRRSVDNGATWKPVINITNNPGHSFEEEFAVSGSNVYVIWEQISAEGNQRDVFFKRSNDNGATWKPTVNISKTSQAYGPHIAVSGTNIHIVWESQMGQIFMRSSTDNGATWKPVKPVSGSGVRAFSPEIDASGSNVYVLYLKLIEDLEHQVFLDLVFVASRDSGATLKPEVTLAKPVIGGSESIPGLDILAIGSKVHVLWWTGNVCPHCGGGLFFHSSSNNGVTWSSIGENLNNRDRRPHVDMVSIGSNVYLVWSHQGIGEVYFLRSINSGATWDSVKNLSENSRNSRNPQIAL